MTENTLSTSASPDHESIFPLLGFAVSMDVRVDRDPRSGVTTAELSGEVNAGSSGDVLEALLKYATECPAAVVVDVSDVRLGPDARPEVFATAFHMAMRGHGVPILVVGADPALAERLAAFRTFVHAYPSRDDAVRALGTWVPRWWHERLMPTATSRSLARGLAGEACLSWGLMHLRESARLIASELVGNAVEHTGQPFSVTVSFSGVYLRIAVQDQSWQLPRLIRHDGLDPAAARSPRGRGLRLVQSTATHWGAVLVPDGKIVWALLRAHPRPAPHHAAPV
jgi:hypothetical protein